MPSILHFKPANNWVHLLRFLRHEVLAHPSSALSSEFYFECTSMACHFVNSMSLEGTSVTYSFFHDFIGNVSNSLNDVNLVLIIFTQFISTDSLLLFRAHKRRC